MKKLSTIIAISSLLIAGVAFAGSNYTVSFENASNQPVQVVYAGQSTTINVGGSYQVNYSTNVTSFQYSLQGSNSMNQCQFPQAPSSENGNDVYISIPSAPFKGAIPALRESYGVGAMNDVAVSCKTN